MSRRNLGWSDKRVHYGEAAAESPGLLLVLALAAVILTSLIPGAPAAAEPVKNDESPVSGNPLDDPDGKQDIRFIEWRQEYFFHKNLHIGHILVITGRVRNDYPKPRCCIKLRGYLLSKYDEILTDGVAYAGNILSKKELAYLPLNEITRRLMNQDGQNETNANVKPGEELPFMLVFDNVPDGTEGFRIDVAASQPAN